MADTTRRPRIALCMIVRDASKTIDALLKSVQYAFDEYVIVDTGSVDDTRAKIASFFHADDEEAEFGRAAEGSASAFSFVWERPENVVYPEEGPGWTTDGRGARLVLATFDWINDFAAARQFSFDLATATWRMFLDADDVMPDANAVRAYVADLEKRAPEINAVSMGYQYMEGDSEQDKIRLVRWLEPDGALVGWRWQDELHEYLVRDNGPKMISKAGAYNVIHMKAPEDHVAASERNRKIMNAVYETADGAKRGRFAYHMSQDAKVRGAWDEAIALQREVVQLLPGSNLAAFALIDSARIHLFNRGDVANALAVAATLVSQMPEYREGFFLNAIALAMRNDFAHAALVFDDALRRPQQLLESVREIWFSQGVALAWAAMVYTELRRFDDAERILADIPPEVAARGEVAGLMKAVHDELMQQKGFAAVTSLVDYLCWTTEAPKALRLLEECVPNSISNRVEIPRMKRSLQRMLRHLDSWEAYKEAYASIPDDDFHTAPEHHENVLKLGRTQRVIAWAKALSPEGPPFVVGCVGVQDGIIEAAVMEANPRIRFVVCDVAPQASVGIRALQELFPGRVTTHHVEANHYDWAGGVDVYDALFIFEVIEHVPDADKALLYVRAALKPGGELFLSTPVSSRWVEPYLTEPGKAPGWYGHVRSNNHVTLWDLLRNAGFNGALYEEWDGTFVAHVKKENGIPSKRLRDGRRVSIFVPGTPKPFNALSHESGFVGGSEECVIHLAKALAKGGYNVTVYCPTPDGFPVVRAYAGVLWRPSEEFDAEGDHGTVLFWRCPEYVPEKAPYKKLLWLHDAFYQVPESVYRRADKLLVLSRSHAQSIATYDNLFLDARAEGHDFVKVAQVSNGIDASAFPELSAGGLLDGSTAALRGRRVIYASSPDRGLERLLDVWPAVSDAVPDAHLDIYYDWSVFEARHPADAERLRAQLAFIAQTDDQSEEGGQSITVHGGVDHETLHAAFRRAAVLAYPTKGPIETFCITAVKAMASGCQPVISDAGALREVTGLDAGETFAVCPKGLNDETVDTLEGRTLFKDALISCLNNGMSHAERVAMREWAIGKYNWTAVAQRFANIIDS